MGNIIQFPRGDDGQSELTALIKQLSGTGPASPYPAFAAGSFGGFDPYSTYGRPQPKLLRRRKTKATYVVRVDLDDAKPPIWRRLKLASDLSLADLHAILQVTMGWTDSHLHHFQMGPDTRDFRMVAFLTDYDREMEGQTGGLYEGDVRLDQVLGQPGHRLFYEYDFGDSWSHTLKLEKIEPWVEDAPEATCVTGRRACPPEDIGGIPGYEEACSILRGEPGHDPEWTRTILEWLADDFDPEHFDADEVNQALQPRTLDLAGWHPALTRLVGRVQPAFSPIPALVDDATEESVELTDDELSAATHRYRCLLEVVGQGLKLTQAGYLPPAIVQELFDDLQLATAWIGVGSREDQTLPVLTLRETAASLGLLRKQRGHLLQTTAGRRLLDNPRGLFEHIRERLPLGRSDAQQDAGLLALLYTAASGDDFYDSRTSAAEAFASLGWASSVSLEQAVWYESDKTRDVLMHLTRSGAPTEHRARIARALLAR